jgi:hypothetical protein
MSLYYQELFKMDQGEKRSDNHPRVAEALAEAQALTSIFNAEA